MSLIPQTDYALLVTLGGGTFCGVQNGIVTFRDPSDSHVMKLYCAWCRNPEDVAMAIKAHREFVKDFGVWEKVEK